MSRKDEAVAELTPLQQALLTIEKLQKKLATATQGDSEPIAIIGMGCRFPGGANSPETFHELLWGGGEALSEIPADRRALQGLYDPDPTKPGKLAMRRAGFVDGADRFDAEFFHISRREAEGMDPQQRFFLEVSWEALEHAGIPPRQLQGTRTGVFAGVHAKDYAFVTGGGLEKVGTHYSTGVDASYVAGRLSYLLGLEGPSMAVDTACSSSLSAVHLACQSLRTEESTLAIAGGVKLILAPHLSVFLSKAGALSPTSRCRTFDREADGMVQGEGCGVVVLKRLRDAVRDGDRILATLRGTGMNHDGASGGLTVPNVRAQEALYRRVLQRAGIDPAQVDYLEAHGTGTRLGDPIELDGVARVYGASRPAERPLWVGSVKPNIGHTEAAAGIAGLIKAVLVLQSGEIPPSLHFEHPTPEFAWEGSGLDVPRGRTPLASKDGPHRVAVSSFGMSGVNAHALVESYSNPTEGAATSGHFVLPLSARTEPALRELAGAWARRLSSLMDLRLGDVCYTAGAGRSHHAHRAALLGATPEALRAALLAVAEGRAVEGVVRGHAKADVDGSTVLVFGDTEPGVERLLRELLEHAAFRRHAEKVDATFRQVAGWSVLEHVARGQGSSGDETKAGVLFVYQVAWAALWQACGLTAVGVAGAGIGALSAAVVSGLLAEEDAIRLSLRLPSTQPVRPQPAKCPYFSFVDAAWVEAGATLPAEAWEQQRAAAVDLHRVAEHLSSRRVAAFVLASTGDAGHEAFEAETRRLGSGALVLRASQQERGAWPGVLHIIARLYGSGVRVRFEGLHVGARKTAVPTYPWQRERFWWDGEHAPAKTAVVPSPSLPVVLAPPSVDGLFCDVSWTEQVAREAQVQAAGHWLIVTEAADGASALHAALVKAGGTVRLARADSDLDAVLRESTSSGQSLRGVVFLASAARSEALDGLSASVLREVTAAVSLVQALSRMAEPPRLVLVTQGAQAADDAAGPVVLSGAPLWGLGRVIAYEHPELACKRIDVDPSLLHAVVPEFVRAGGATSDDDEVVLRGEKRLTPSFTQDLTPKREAGAFRPRADRTYLITGGLGGIGLRLASWLAAHGARHLALCGRKGETEEARLALAPLRDAGVRVATFRVDVSRAEQVAEMLESLRRGGAPLGGIFHSAGVLADSSLLQWASRDFETVMGPKVQGAWNLHALATDATLEQFVLFSSTASLMGSPGQASYAAANAFLDALAQLRRARGLPAVSLNWGSWGEVGMAVADARRGERLAGQGMSPMSVDEALAAMAQVLVENPIRRGIARFDAERWCASHPSIATSSLFRGASVPEEATEAESAPRKLREVLLSLEGSARREALEIRLKEMVSEVGKIPAAKLSPSDSFDALGFDSIMALELRDLVLGELDVSMPLKSFVDDRSIEQVTVELLEKLAVASVLSAAPSERGESKRVLL
ncbi:Malonyl CoA-acyl carrier protein transacylase [Myxococcus hansupus]|uniref:Malonyl CoA-acyl carrier protein transacylase n=1 Tax=Pseudomyxococcus hansupus TaxID=1297742 RepID=A0A0H4XCG9_9BACT|nr:type I polyketide synthase [Myxococcus hansupus]AKQ65677.1 Malonyl CoA-acyl carrier protein transacylase [Myxococcus hansupus]